MKKRIRSWLGIDSIVDGIGVLLARPLHRYEVVHGRRQGRTTRIADLYIQILFEAGCVTPHDHHPTRKADEAMLRVIRDRLHREHTGLGWREDHGTIYLTTLNEHPF